MNPRRAHHRLLAGCALALLASGGPALAQTLAFPGAEGAGRFSQGGRGGAVIKVTNLNDSGPGSLRAAVEAKGPRTVVFAIAGAIALKSDLKIAEPRITIAGQTAPGGGITLRDHTLVVSADDVVIRFIRSRLGDESRTESDAIWINGGRRIILDHVSASWSVDETLSASARYGEPGQGFFDLTVQWSIIAESMAKSLHAKGAHGFGSLIRGGRGSRISFHHNLWANHIARMPRPGNYDGIDQDPVGAFFDFRSNVFYNWGKGHAGYNADKAALAAYNFVGNTYLPGPSTTKAIAFHEGNSLASAYFADNSMAGAIPADPWSLVTFAIPEPKGYRLARPIDMDPVTSEPAPASFARVLAEAGASVYRDAVDTRIVAGVRDRTGKIIDSQKDVGGWPALPAGRAAPDADGDGMPDAWEKARGLDPRAAADGPELAKDGSGYTNLELYLADAARRRG